MFPGGWPGLGLLLLRLAIGGTAFIQGVAYLGDRANSNPWAWMIGALAALCGVCLVVGFLTPVAGGLVGLVAAGIAFSWLPPAAPNLFNAILPTVLVIVIAAALVLLGPGALSIDARSFGRREIVIPRIQRPRDS